jgi:hypothetical protein
MADFLKNEEVAYVRKLRRSEDKNYKISYPQKMYLSWM